MTAPLTFPSLPSENNSRSSSPVADSKPKKPARRPNKPKAPKQARTEETAKKAAETAKKAEHNKRGSGSRRTRAKTEGTKPQEKPQAGAQAEAGAEEPGAAQDRGGNGELPWAAARHDRAGGERARARAVLRPEPHGPGGRGDAPRAPGMPVQCVRDRRLLCQAPRVRIERRPGSRPQPLDPHPSHYVPEARGSGAARRPAHAGVEPEHARSQGRRGPGDEAPAGHDLVHAQPDAQAAAEARGNHPAAHPRCPPDVALRQHPRGGRG
ncbi:hypothetical protein DL89DRAFT_36281 [Linderina pennispora]|uniref:Uncharacterized protein n=1 Tax=Linderina pennispora TaxID=61395 RepID=A0A1Y1W2G7_9FUNG|nr:uncharacterized protein DL89DRAFT_36281 [Linderina pennispora]ORX67753.1 hypothetical protein DL89DRAFT_36281 [Linderina pennispora]